MSAGTSIEWTDATWNPTVGCSIVSPGCTNCYAMKLAGRLEAMGSPIYAGVTMKTKAGFVWNGKVEASSWGQVTKPLEWKKPRRIFVNSMSDLFHEAMPRRVIDQVFGVMALCPQHTFQVLTKRPERMLGYVSQMEAEPSQAQRLVDALDVSREHIVAVDWPLPNVLLGTSVEDLTRAKLHRPFMAAIAGMGWRTFASYEPALGPVLWSGWDFLKWLISGGESGPGARPSHPFWHRLARDFCAEHGIAYFFKQWGDWAPEWFRDDGPPAREHDWGDGTHSFRIGKANAPAVLDNHAHREFPR